MINKNIYNLPNALALFRVFLAPVMLWFFLARDSAVLSGIHVSWLDYMTALIFVIASVTDFFDGFIARTWNQMTVLGSVLDPLADKMLILAGLLGLMALNRVDVWIVFIILTREFLITGLRVVAIEQKINIASSFTGKVKTVAQMFAIGFLTMQWNYGTELIWLATFLTVYSGLEYIIAYKKAIK